MPITQDRFYKVISAAREIFTSLADIRQAAISELAKADAKQQTERQALDNILRAVLNPAIDPNALVTLGNEEKHYQLTHKKNAYQAEKQKLRRMGQGIEPRKKAPDKKIDKWEFEMETPSNEVYDNIAAAASVIELGPEQAPPPGDLADVIAFGPEPSPIEQSQQILADNELLKELEPEMQKLHEKEPSK